MDVNYYIYVALSSKALLPPTYTYSGWQPATMQGAGLTIRSCLWFRFSGSNTNMWTGGAGD